MTAPFITIDSPAGHATVSTTFTANGGYGGDIPRVSSVACSLSYPDNPIPIAGMVNQTPGKWSCTFNGVPTTGAGQEATVSASLQSGGQDLADAHVLITIQ
jgi:hypothetical protein